MTFLIHCKDKHSIFSVLFNDFEPFSYLTFNLLEKENDYYRNPCAITDNDVLDVSWYTSRKSYQAEKKKKGFIRFWFSSMRFLIGSMQTMTTLCKAVALCFLLFMMHFVTKKMHNSLINIILNTLVETQ